jgi:hypothetical protein
LIKIKRRGDEGALRLIRSRRHVNLPRPDHRRRRKPAFAVSSRNGQSRTRQDRHISECVVWNASGRTPGCVEQEWKSRITGVAGWIARFRALLLVQRILGTSNAISIVRSKSERLSLFAVLMKERKIRYGEIPIVIE